MDFSKLTTEDLSQFLQMYQIAIPQTTEELTKSAGVLFGSLKPTDYFPLSVVDLYLAHTLITQGTSSQYRYSLLRTEDISHLSSLFLYFQLPANEESRTRLIHILGLANMIIFDPIVLLPDELIKMILQCITDKDLVNLFSVSSRFKSVDDNNFWQTRYEVKYGMIGKTNRLSWKQMYRFYPTQKDVPLYDKLTTTKFSLTITDTLSEIYEKIRAFGYHGYTINYQFGDSAGFKGYIGSYYMKIFSSSHGLMMSWAKDGQEAGYMKLVPYQKILPSFSHITSITVG